MRVPKRLKERLLAVAAAKSEPQGFIPERIVVPYQHFEALAGMPPPIPPRVCPRCGELMALEVTRVVSYMGCCDEPRSSVPPKD